MTPTTTSIFRSRPELLRQAQYRLKFDELLGVQLNIQSRRTERLAKSNGFLFTRVGGVFNTFYTEKLPFPLTGAQKRVIREIRRDTVTGFQMNRLLQGDVGSGKTLVALMSMLLAVDNGYQACMMAPTEILARQHFATITRMLDGMDVKVAVLTGASKARERRASLEGIASGEGAHPDRHARADRGPRAVRQPGVRGDRRAAPLRRRAARPALDQEPSSRRTSS